MDLSELGFPNRNAPLGSGSQSQLNSPKERASILDDQESLFVPPTSVSLPLQFTRYMAVVSYLVECEKWRILRFPFLNSERIIIIIIIIFEFFE